MKNKINKNVVPEGFSLGMVFSDMLPVVFFGATSFLIGLILKNLFMTFGAAVTFLSGLIKVIWKLVVVLKKKNVWPLFIQMRIIMPIGFIIFIIGLASSLVKLPFLSIISALTAFPQICFFIFGFLGMIAMIIFAVKLDSSDAKSNWIEQITNGVAQACFFVGMLFVYFS